jgi:pyruvate/2-oxoglutarate dehydrogenase complex dihydrolipoamide acyltransferase (E2) component
MSHRLDPQAVGASVTLAVRFDAAALAVIDRERQRLEDLTGESCDRSRALRSIVRRWGALAEGEVNPTAARSATAAPRATSSSSPRAKAPTATSSKTSTTRSTPSSKSKPSAGRWEPVAAADLRQLARDLAGLDATALRACIDGSGVGRSAVYAAKNGKAGRPTFTALRAWLTKNREGA